jgi:hypothetical protein
MDYITNLLHGLRAKVSVQADLEVAVAGVVPADLEVAEVAMVAIIS